MHVTCCKSAEYQRSSEETPALISHASALFSARAMGTGLARKFRAPFTGVSGSVDIILELVHLLAIGVSDRCADVLLAGRRTQLV